MRASHILIGVPQGADAVTKDAARKRAEGVLKQVKAGKDFAALAKEHSQDPGSAVQGGDLGFFPRGQMVGPFDEAAFTLAPGAISDLVETQFGFHIIRVVEKQAARTVPLEEVKPKLDEFLLNQNKQRETQAFVDRLEGEGQGRDPPVGLRRTSTGPVTCDSTPGSTSRASSRRARKPSARAKAVTWR